MKGHGLLEDKVVVVTAAAGIAGGFLTTANCASCCWR